jgi:hypothetical protein
MMLFTSLTLLIFGAVAFTTANGRVGGAIPLLVAAGRAPQVCWLGLHEPLRLPLPGRAFRTPLDALGGVRMDFLAGAPVSLPGWYLSNEWQIWVRNVIWPVGLGTAVGAQLYRYRRVSSAYSASRSSGSSSVSRRRLWCCW